MASAAESAKLEVKMIPLNPTLKLVIGLVLVAAIGALSALVKVEPAWSWAGTVIQVLTALELFFTPTSAALPPKDAS